MHRKGVEGQVMGTPFPTTTENVAVCGVVGDLYMYISVEVEVEVEVEVIEGKSGLVWREGGEVDANANNGAKME